MEGNKPMILKAMPKTSIIVKFLALVSQALLVSDAQDLPSQLLLIAKRREHGSIVFIREALINSIVGSAARGLIWICK